MNKENLIKWDPKKETDDILHSVLDLLQKDDGKNFEEKKDELSNYLLAEVALLQEGHTPLPNGQATSPLKLKMQFWQAGKVTTSDRHITLRPVQNSDREDFLQLEKEYCEFSSSMKDASFQNSLWEEHTSDQSIILAIEHNDTYIGYCGIRDITCDLWEISIELQSQWTGRGIGGIVLTAMLDAIEDRLAVHSFRVRVEPSNYASQRVFERLGAKPNGISEMWLHNPQLLEQYEEENLHLIDARLTAVAEKFDVAPRKLLSHVLEYTLIWERNRNM